jgi:hypothetical protein
LIRNVLNLFIGIILVGGGHAQGVMAVLKVGNHHALRVIPPTIFWHQWEGVMN